MKKILALCLALTMALAVFAGCSGAASSSAPAAGSASGSASTGGSATGKQLSGKVVYWSMYNEEMCIRDRHCIPSPHGTVFSAASRSG